MTDKPTPQAEPDRPKEIEAEQADKQQQGQTAPAAQPDPRPTQGRRPLFRN